MRRCIIQANQQARSQCSGEGARARWRGSQGSAAAQSASGQSGLVEARARRAVLDRRERTQGDHSDQSSGGGALAAHRAAASCCRYFLAAQTLSPFAVRRALAVAAGAAECRLATGCKREHKPAGRAHSAALRSLLTELARSLGLLGSLLTAARLLHSLHSLLAALAARRWAH